MVRDMKFGGLFAGFAALALLAGCSEKPAETEDRDDADHGMVFEDVDGHEEAVQAGSYADFALSAGDRIYYGFDKYSITSEYQATAEREAGWLNDYNHINVLIAGHCDKRGTQEYNLALGNRRAESHKNALVAAGVDPSRVTVTSYGKERPLVEGDTERDYALNRVTVVHFD